MIICGKEFSAEKIEQIRDIIAENGQKSRTYVSRQVCEALERRSQNGNLKDAGCRVVLLRLQREWIIQLPEAQERPRTKTQKGRGRQDRIEQRQPAVQGKSRVVLSLIW